MAKLPRVIQKIFGLTANPGELNVIGSFAAGSPTPTTDPTAMQALANYLEGWFACVLGSGTVNAPTIQDMNSLMFLMTYQLAYLMEQGVPEWDATTTYYVGSIVSDSGNLYVSLVNASLNQAVNQQLYWKQLGGGQTFIAAATYTALYTDDVILANAAANNIAVTLPPVNFTPKGKRIVVKNTGAGAFTVTVSGNAAELIDFANAYPAFLTTESAVFFNSGTQWWVI